MSLLRTPGLAPPSQWQSQPDPEVEPGGRRALGDSALDLEKDPGARTLLCGVAPGSGRRLGVDELTALVRWWRGWSWAFVPA